MKDSGKGNRNGDGSNSGAGGGTSRFSISIPADAKVPSAPGDAVLPFPPPLVKLALPVEVAGYEFKVETPVESSIAKTHGDRDVSAGTGSGGHAYRGPDADHGAGETATRRR